MALIGLSFYQLTSAEEFDTRRLIQGAFQGQVFNGDDMDNILTIFRQDAKGELRGIYTITEEEGMEVGYLTDFKWESQFVLKCKWRDKYGIGSLRMLFSAQYAMFYGFWGNSDDSTYFPWDGMKQEQTSNQTNGGTELRLL